LGVVVDNSVRQTLGQQIENARGANGVTQVIGPNGIVLEEISPDGKLVVDPIKDVGFDP